MTRFSLKSLAGRKFRTVLTALAIVLGVAMISGTYVLTDTIDKAFSSIFADSYAGTDAVVSGKEASFSADFEKPPVAPVDASLLDDIRGVDSVALAMGGVYDEVNTKIIAETFRQACDMAESHGERLAAEGEICWGGMHSWRAMLDLLESVDRPQTLGFQADMAHTLLYTLGANAPEAPKPAVASATALASSPASGRSAARSSRVWTPAAPWVPSRCRSSPSTWPRAASSPKKKPATAIAITRIGASENAV